MRHGDFEYCICGLCGQQPKTPISNKPLERMREAREQGFYWIMIKSGMDPVYQWRCKDCQQHYSRPQINSSVTTEDQLFENFLNSIERAGHGQTVPIVDALRLVREIRRLREKVSHLKRVRIFGSRPDLN